MIAKMIETFWQLIIFHRTYFVHVHMLVLLHKLTKLFAKPSYTFQPMNNHQILIFYNNLRGGAGKSLTQLTSRYRRTESIVSLERGVCSCAELQGFSCYRD